MSAPKTSDLPVVASVAWKCDKCDVRDTLHLARGVDVLGLAARIRLMHRELSPDCPNAGKGPEGVAQVDTPPDAFVNDPRERDKMQPRARLVGTLLGALAAAVAIDRERPEGDAASARRVPEEPRAVSPYDPEARELARKEARARRRDSAMAAADAKRKMRAAKRRGDR